MVNHPAIKLLRESDEDGHLLGIMAEEIKDLEEAISTITRNKGAQVKKELDGAIEKNEVDKWLDKYFPGGEFSFAGLGTGRGTDKQSIERYLANKPEELEYLKKRIIGYVKQALETKGVGFEGEKEEYFGSEWLATPAQLPPTKDSSSTNITPEIRQQFENRLKDIVEAPAVEPFLSFFTLLVRQQVREEVTLPQALQGANLLGGENTSKVREALLQMEKSDRITILQAFKQLDSTKQTYLVDMIKDVLPEVPAKVEPEIVDDEEEETAQQDPETEEGTVQQEPETEEGTVQQEPETEEVVISKEDLDHHKEKFIKFFSSERRVGFMQQMFLDEQSKLLVSLLSALRGLLGDSSRAKAIGVSELDESQHDSLDVPMGERRAIVKDMKNIKITMEDLVFILKRYREQMNKVSAYEKFDGTKLKKRVKNDLEDTQIAIAKLYRNIVKVILSGEDIIKEQDEGPSAEEKAKNVRRVYGELLTTYNDSLEPIIRGEVDFDGATVKNTAQSMLDLILSSGIVDYFPSENIRFSPKVDARTTLKDAMNHLADSLKELATFISRVFARVNTNDITEAQARTFLKKLRDISIVLERDFGAESVINALPEIEEENPENSLGTPPQNRDDRTMMDRIDDFVLNPLLSQPANIYEKIIPIVEKIIKDQHG